MSLKKIALTLILASLALAMLAWATPSAAAQDTAASAVESVSVPAGSALTEGEVIILLQAKVSLDVIQKFVTVRGVNFQSTKESSKRIISAGGNVALIGTINLNQKEDAAAAAALEMGGKKKK